MAIIHCGFVPHQNKSINQTAGFRRNNPADDSTTKSKPRPLATIMEKLLITILFLIGIFSFGQDLKCADFKNGKFITPADSIFPYQGTILRKNGKQVEWSTQSLDTTYLDIKYLDDCNYVMTYNSIKNNLENIEKYINASGGMRVEVIQIKGDTLFYNGIIKNDSIKFEQPGKLIKVE